MRRTRPGLSTRAVPNSGGADAELPGTDAGSSDTTEEPISARGASLVGVLLVVLIIGALGAVAVSSLPSLTGGPGDSLLGGPGGVTTDPGSVGTPAARGPAGPGGLRDAASVAACRANEQTVEAAVAADYASTGAYPATIDALVAGHWLSEAPVGRGYTLSLESLGGKATGRVLVDGHPGRVGCDGAPPAGK